MNTMQRLTGFQQRLYAIKRLDFVVLLAIRMYLFPWIWRGGMSKYNDFNATVLWFSLPGSEGGLNLPFPVFLAVVTIFFELIGSLCLLLGLAVRWFSIPLIFIMGVAGVLVHWHNGYVAIADHHFESTLRLNEFMLWLQSYFPGRFNYITELGDVVILNNGIEFPVTYGILLAVLVMYGGGRYVSMDYYLHRRWMRR